MLGYTINKPESIKQIGSQIVTKQQHRVTLVNEPIKKH